MVIGERIKKRREELGLTQMKVCEFTGITQGYLSMLERGEYEPTATKIVLLSGVLHISTDELLGLKSDREKILEMIYAYRDNKKKFGSADKFIMILEYILRKRL